MTEHGKGKPSARLRPLLLSPEEWQVIQELEPILNVLERTTEEVSKEAHPLLHQVIPYIDALNSVLEKHLRNKNLLPCVRAAVARAIAVLDKYYSKTDESIMWKTAMLLHPRYKVFYFREQEWEEEWIDTAIKSACEVWQTHYKIHVTAVPKPTKDDDDPLAAVASYGLTRMRCV
ncbi:hypothetical protein MPER_04758 [Moniliophthora perniciosa FA553]|nr:hypothetical protein MPER_04758 [Moniliophthora perniciosa FA553]